MAKAEMHLNSNLGSEEPSLQHSLNKLAEALKIASEESKKYYLRDASEVSEETLKEVDIALVPLSNLILNFGTSWMEAKRRGPDAVVASKKLEDRIDMKLLRSGKLDFEQLKKIMSRLNRLDDALWGLNRIIFYISHYKELCAEKELKRQVGHVELLEAGVLNSTKEMIRLDGERLTNQIDRCNLYFQDVLKSKTFRVAIISLFISSLAVFLSILSIILPTILNLLN